MTESAERTGETGTRTTRAEATRAEAAGARGPGSRGADARTVDPRTDGVRAVGPRAAADVVHESYSFACMRCGHGWEQSFEIEHHFDAEGTAFVTYVANGTVVPSPLSRPSCQNCGGHVLRIMRPGRVSSAQRSLYGQRQDAARPAPRRVPKARRGEPGAESSAAGGGSGGRRHWHFSDLLHLFAHRQHRTS
ncbi:hypothetical protein ACH4KC_09995 [Streptomyces griseoaurantiacus]|uniref:hypothetical protein n=1 Tax=Streptomyces griseoaurantiacus TaxID=68213 RepID=UPI00379EE6C4